MYVVLTDERRQKVWRQKSRPGTYPGRRAYVMAGDCMALPVGRSGSPEVAVNTATVDLRRLRAVRHGEGNAGGIA